MSRFSIKTSIGFLTIIIFITSISLFGCAANNSQLKDKVNTTSVNKDYETGYGDNAGSESKGSNSSSTSTIDAISGRKVIFTATLDIESTNYPNSISTLEKMISEHGGYIQDSNVETSTSFRSSTALRTATYTIRMPSIKLSAFLSKSGDIGNIVLNKTNGEDVTDQYFDTAARLQSLKIQEERLLALLKNANTLKDMLDIEDRLTQVRFEIEQLTGTLKQIDSRVELSTVTVTIIEVDTITISEPKPIGFWSQVASTFKTSLKALVETLRVLTLVFVALLPFLVVIGIILLVVYFIYRRATKRKKISK